MRRTVERLVGLFIWFSAVLLWPIVLNVTVWSLFFALSMWKVQCTCGSLLFICPTSAFTVAPLVARNGGTPCWIPFSSAVPGFALPNRFRGVRDLCFTVVEGPLCVRLPIYFLIQRHGSDSTHGSSVYLRSEGRPSISDNLWVVVWTRLLDRKSSFLGCFSRGRRGKSKNRAKNRIFGLVEPRSAVFRPYFHVFSRRGGF